MARNVEGVPRLPSAAEESNSSESEELMAAAVGTPVSKRWRQALAVAGILCVAGASTFAVRALTPQPAPRLRAPTTVRALLEGPDLADLATDNVMAVGGESLAKSVTRDEVRLAVGRKLQNISDTIHELYPEDHRRLDTIQLSAAQRESVFDTLRHYGDHRMVDLTGVIADTVKETAKASGDEKELKRRLTEKLQPRLSELRQLGEELFPGRDGGIALNLDHTPVVDGFRQWHVRMGMSDPKRLNARRLSVADLASGVEVQAKTMFHKLTDMFGDEMPQAPERVLTSTSQEEDENLMACMLKAMQDMSVPGCVGCIFSNMQAVLAMVGQMMMGGR